MDLSGDFYSEDEADDFKEAKPQGETYPPAMLDFLKESFTQFMTLQKTKEEVQSFYTNNGEVLTNLKTNHSDVYEKIKQIFKDRILEIKNSNQGDINE